MGHPDLVVVSNRGPLSFSVDDDGQLVSRRGGGGLVSTLGPAVAGTGATWIAAALSDADRQAAAGGVVEAEGFRLRSLVVDDDLYRQYYDVIANASLWFVYHGLFDLSRRPRIDRRWYDAWAAFRAVNEAFAAAVVDEAGHGATVLVQDYHLPLVGATLARERPDLKTAYFNHTPFCSPTGIRVLPDEMALELLNGLAGYGACGFHTKRWAEMFERCCHELLGRVPPTFVSPAAVGVEHLQMEASSADCDAEVERLDGLAGDRAVIVRVDRIELSKNLLRGFHAFEELLRALPQWRERVVFAAFVYPSRIGLADYLSYRAEVEALVERINTTWATPSWTPILLDVTDDYHRSLAGLRRYDVLVVNPVRDGWNLVAVEGPTINERDGAVVISREAGVFDLLAGEAIEVNPFDVAGTADALARALAMAGEERSARAAALRRAATGRTPADWLDDQVRAARLPS